MAEKREFDMKKMNPMVHLALRTGHTFKHVFGQLDQTISYGSESGAVGVADSGNTFSHSMMEIRCGKISRVEKTLSKLNQAKNIKPIYGVRLTVVKDATEKVPPRGQWGPEYIFIAKNKEGLSEIYNLVKMYYENFYYRGNISIKDVYSLSKNVIVIAENFEKKKRIDYIALTCTTPKKIRNMKGIPKVAIVNNYYPTPMDKDTYQLFTYPRNDDEHTYPQHILSTEEWYEENKDHPEALDAIENTRLIAKKCAGFELDKADLVRYKGSETVGFLCKIGAKRLGVNLNKSPYKERYEREITLIEERGFQDYFLIVADMIRKAKRKMLVGPGRGSAGGSLVCYLLGITESIDPIEFDLLFERFIDINRSDLPDIDIDFPDNKRESVVKQLVKDYGQEQVKRIANVSTMQPKITITEFSKSLRIPVGDVEELKNSIIERSGGDARAAQCMEDTFETIEVGKEFIKKYPQMKNAPKIEGHPRHSSVHAAGIIVCNDPVHKYAGVNSRDDTAMVDKKTAEYLGLLKIDVLGLRTLSILEDCADMVGMRYEEYYKIPLDCEKTFSIFNDMRLSGIFQFEGYSLQGLTRKMGIHSFEDVTAITSLARPGALYSGGARRYINYRIGEEEPVFLGGKHTDITKDTFGIVVYQEQILRICREIGKMSWEDVNDLRRALSKSLGKEYFNRYKKKFIKGATKKKNYTEEEAEFLWSEVENGGAYAFNRSHAAAYALISYWCAYMKVRYPKEFTVANLNNSKTTESAIKILRDATENEDIEYTAIDPDESLKNWSINSKGIIVGGLLNISGIGPANANKIIKSRETGEKLAPGIIKKMLNPETDFDVLYPCKHLWGDIYDYPKKYGLSSPPDNIVDVQSKGRFLFIGLLKDKNIRDLNEYVNVQKRGGKLLEDNSLMLSIKLEDDTDSIMCNIDRFTFEEKGRHIAEHAVIETDWFMVKGEIKYEGRYVAVQEIMKLDNSVLEG